MTPAAMLVACVAVVWDFFAGLGLLDGFLPRLVGTEGAARSQAAVG